MKRLFLALFLVVTMVAAAYAVTVGDKMVYEGPVTFKGTVTQSGAATQSAAQTFENTVTLDDGSGASPSFVMTDATNESATFSKVDAGFLTVTTVAGDGVQVTTGNFKVGNGTPGVSQDGEDAYVEGTLEVDGATTFDGNVTAGNAVTDGITFTGAILGASPFILDGTTDNTNELTVTLGADPAGDLTLTLPATVSSAAMISTLATNDAEVANSVWGASNGIVMEGATANNYETTIAPTDPTADRTITLPDGTGTVNLNCTASHDYAGAAVAWTMTAAEAACSAISVTNANGAIDAVLPSAIPGKTYTVINGSGQTVTLKVTGQTGGTVANTKWALYTTVAADVVEVYELP